MDTHKKYRLTNLNGMRVIPPTKEICKIWASAKPNDNAHGLPVFDPILKYVADEILNGNDKMYDWYMEYMGCQAIA